MHSPRFSFALPLPALDLGELGIRGSGALITDGDGGDLSFRKETISFAAGQKLEVTLKPHGGFVLVSQ